MLATGAAWLLRLLVEWLADLVGGPFAAITSIGEPWLTAGTFGLGLLAGGLFAYAMHDMAFTVTVSAEQVRMRHDGVEKTFARADISAVFVEDDQFVLLGHDAGELVYAFSELPEDELASAFVRHDYPWHDGDPHIDDYRRWRPEGDDELPAGAAELLTARSDELDKWDSDEADRLRSALGELGVIVREDGRRQYWRLTGTM